LIDTLRVTIQAELELNWHDAELVSIIGRGKDQKISHKWITRGIEMIEDRKIEGLPRLTYNGNLLMCEVSLPKFLNGENATVLSENEVFEGYKKLHSWVCEKVDKKLPNIVVWNTSRVDYCYSWQVGDLVGQYINAFASVPINGYSRQSYVDGENKTQGNTWRCKSVKVNCYDKGLESKLDFAAGVLRLEIQNLNSNACRNVALRNDLGQFAGDLIDNGVAKKELTHWFDRIGHHKRIFQEDDLMEILLKNYGSDGAASRYFFAMALRKMPGSVKDYYSKRTLARRISESKKEGWLFQAEKELPVLEIK
jgi:hypothetical protein